MKNKLVVLLLFFSFHALGQHCGFDFASIIVIKIHAFGDTTIIPNLKITLLDSNNQKLMRGKDTAIFRQNPNKPTFKSFNKGEYYNFPFAKDNYVFIVHEEFIAKNYRVKIEDIDGSKNGGQFFTKIIPLYEQDKYSLCGKYYDTEYTVSFGTHRMYHPIEIVLFKKD